MTTWNYRIVRYRGDPESLGLHEVYYNDSGLPYGMSAEPTSFVCMASEGVCGIQAALASAIFDAHRLPIFDEPEIWPGEVHGGGPSPHPEQVGS